MSAKSCESLRSVQSSSSIGIGSESLSNKLKVPSEGSINNKDRLFDCIVLLIYCPQHRKVAVIESKRCRFVWIPFIQIREDSTWEQNTRGAVEKLIGRQDAEMDAASAAKLVPQYSLHKLDITRIQMTSLQFFVRLCQLVKLEQSTEFKCCVKNAQVDWLAIEEIVEDRSMLDSATDNHWGPELKVWCQRVCRHLTKQPESIPVTRINEYLLHNQALTLLSTEGSCEQKALLGMKLKPEHVVEMYEDFIRHCYPSMYMRYDSFRTFLLRNNFCQKTELDLNSARINVNMGKVYDSFRTKRRDYIDFDEFLLGIVCMDPKCKDRCEARIRHIFRYYARSKNFLAEEDFKQLIMDSQDGVNVRSELTTLYSETLAQFSVAEVSKISFTIFYKAVVNHPFLITKLLRFSRSILQQISIIYAQRVNPKGSVEQPKQKCLESFGGGECMACQPHQYEYGIHAVSLSTSGRCIDPRIINRYWIEESLYQQNRLYSMEYTFSFRSVSNIFLDFVREFNRNKSFGLIGLMSNKDEWTVMHTYLKILCRQLNGILSAESKLLKLNGPALVFGDLQGNLSDLCLYEETLFASFPVIPENLIFLGNYSGEFPYGVECLIYLFSLKICAPNKVYLLRGLNETRCQNYRQLRPECIQKYGSIKGESIYEAFNDVFSRLPIAVILDESILCSHSGIPFSNKRVVDLSSLPQTLTDIQKQAPMAYEMLTRVPNTYTTGNDKIDVSYNQPGDLTFHSNSHYSSLCSLESNSFSELILASTEIKSADPAQACKSNTTEIRSNVSGKTPKSVYAKLDPKISAAIPLEETMMFDKKNFLNFLDMNDLNFLIRSNGVCKTGYKRNFLNKCLTVFSCSNICNYRNMASVVLVDRSTSSIRFLCLDVNAPNASTNNVNRSTIVQLNSSSASFQSL